MLINSTEPSNWRALQSDVAKILTECGFNAETEKNIATARGEVQIDVFAEDSSQAPPARYLCECKHWNSNIPREKVHAFRTVVHDYGANWGLMVSKLGFQSGAYAAAENTNLRLLNWQEFQELFHERWYREYMVKKLPPETESLVDYTEPINTRVFRKAGALPPESQERFSSLREKYGALAFFALRFYMPRSPYGDSPPELPLRENLPELLTYGAADIRVLPENILDANTLRDLLDSIIEHLRIGTEEFDEVFGERA
ncbi:restriction endonuclease [Acidobacteriota bacterium]